MATPEVQLEACGRAERMGKAQTGREEEGRGVRADKRGKTRGRACVKVCVVIEWLRFVSVGGSRACVVTCDRAVT